MPYGILKLLRSACCVNCRHLWHAIRVCLRDRALYVLRSDIIYNVCTLLMPSTIKPDWAWHWVQYSIVHDARYTNKWSCWSFHANPCNYKFVRLHSTRSNNARRAPTWAEGSYVHKALARRVWRWALLLRLLRDVFQRLKGPPFMLEPCPKIKKWELSACDNACSCWDINSKYVTCEIAQLSCAGSLWCFMESQRDVKDYLC